MSAVNELATAAKAIPFAHVVMEQYSPHFKDLDEAVMSLDRQSALMQRIMANERCLENLRYQRGNEQQQALQSAFLEIIDISNVLLGVLNVEIDLSVLPDIDQSVIDLLSGSGKKSLAFLAERKLDPEKEKSFNLAYHFGAQAFFGSIPFIDKNRRDIQAQFTSDDRTVLSQSMFASILGSLAENFNVYSGSYLQIGRELRLCVFDTFMKYVPMEQISVDGAVTPGERTVETLKALNFQRLAEIAEQRLD